MFAYAVGKAQRVLGGLDLSDDRSIGPIYAHCALQRMNKEYRKIGIALPETLYAVEEHKRGESFAGALVLAPLSLPSGPPSRDCKGGLPPKTPINLPNTAQSSAVRPPSACCKSLGHVSTTRG